MMTSGFVFFIDLIALRTLLSTKTSKPNCSYKGVKLGYPPSSTTDNKRVDILFRF